MGTRSEAYFRVLLDRYRANFDIFEDYTLENKVYPAYARFFSLGEKYVLKKEAKLWAIRAYEHVLFIKTDSIDQTLLDEVKRTMEQDMEPAMVRRGEKYPEKDHMCSYLSFVIISETTPSPEIQKAIRKFRFDKGYLMNFRGHSEGKLGCVFLDSETCLTNYAAKELKTLFLSIFKSQKGNKEEKVS
ncbi:hypothetical protein [Butyrivibrio sp. MC2021]|uniref:hypothetical protein n=1 Tax=Butyrivibrio sp. MC2021 TaxID=1408306 RepID=UPI00068917AC|nr:hypothetical protein [Butyrivibrio sp. MC2021]